MKQFILPQEYETSIVRQLKKERLETDRLKKDLTPFIIQKKNVTFYLPRNFGFCYGVENAIHLTYQTIQNNTSNKRIFLLSELIHNSQVNDFFLEKGIRFLMKNDGTILIPFENLSKEDIVLVPAFGTTIEIENQLKSIGVEIEKYDTTCPFVEKVWKKGHQLKEQGYTIILHGKPEHEETKATFSHVTQDNNPCIIIRDMEEAKLLNLYISKQKDIQYFAEDFKNRYTTNFDPKIHLDKIGVINQTTILSYETQAIADYFKDSLVQFYKLTPENVHTHFSETRDTLCYATNENQKAVEFMAKNYSTHLNFIIGGYNSSNTINLYKISSVYSPSYFIKDENSLINISQIQQFNIKSKAYEIIESDILKQENLNVSIIIGASCPDYMVDKLIAKILLLRNQK